MSTIPYLGEILSLLTAVTWAIAVILFKKSGELVHPVALNLFKNGLTVLLFIPTIPLLGEALFPAVTAKDYALLLLSGVLGIGIADTLFFKSLNILGAGTLAIIDCLYSPFVIGLSIVFLGEDLTLYQFLGVAMIIFAVLAIMARRDKNPADRKKIWLGIFYGALGIALCSAAIVMIKPVLERTPLVWATGVRLVGGIASLIIYLAFHPRRKPILSSLFITGGWKYTISASVMGVYVAMTLWLAGMKYTQVATAAPLNQTSSIFIFIFAAIFLQEPVSPRKFAGLVLGTTGAILVTLF
ncbi:MAG: DMT family transporter [bacterium]|nr:DMT family transporter [bacterium]